MSPSSYRTAPLRDVLPSVRVKRLYYYSEQSHKCQYFFCNVLNIFNDIFFTADINYNISKGYLCSIVIYAIINVEKCMKEVVAIKQKITVNFGQSKGIINRNIYGHFSEQIGGVFYDGLWVGEDSDVENIGGFRKALIDSFKKINPPILRWPGGCFAETYDWRDGIGPRDSRPVRVNWWYPDDGRTESNQVGTHEFVNLCRMVGAEPYFAANLTSTTPLNIRNWMEYCNFPDGSTTLACERANNGDCEPFNVHYWGIGNENWGGGGNMTPEQYAREFVRYTTVCNSLGRNNRFIICGANGHDIEWTRRLLSECKGNKREVPACDMSIHYYCSTAGAPQTFTEDEWYKQLFQADYMRRVVDDHRAAMDEFDPDRKIKLFVDEWGCWHKGGSGPSKGYNLFEQQSSMRDAVVAAMTLNIFNNRCDIVAMSSVAQLCNCLQSLYLASENNFVETPNYFVFDMFKTHQDAVQYEVLLQADSMEREGFKTMEMLSASASVKDGTLTLTVANLDMTNEKKVELSSIYGSIAGSGVVTVLSSDDPHDCNTFEMPTKIKPVMYEKTFAENDELTIPAASVVSIVINL